MAGDSSSSDSDSDSEKVPKGGRQNEHEEEEAKEASSKKQSKAEKINLLNEIGKEESRKRKFNFLSLDAYTRHKILVNEYLLTHAGSTAKLSRNRSKDKTDYDILRENHKFLWDEDDEADTWSKQLAKKYYDKLFKEYCICDLTRYKENQVAMRWRTEQEVLDGKGQFKCGEKHCQADEALRSWEVNFGYVEHGVKKNALVKLRLCDDCSKKLNYHKQRKEVKRKKRVEREEKALGSRRKKQKAADEKSRDSKSSSSPEAEKPTDDRPSTDNAAEGASIWSGPPDLGDVDKSIEEEVDDYLTDLFM